MFNSLRIKIFLLFVFGLSIGLLIIIVIFTSEIRDSYKELFLERANNSAMELKLKTEQLLDLGLYPNEFYGYEKICEEIKKAHEGISYIALLDNKNNAIYQVGDSKFYKKQKGSLKEYIIKLPVKSYTSVKSSIFVVVDKNIINNKTYDFFKSILLCTLITIFFVIIVVLIYLKKNLGKPLDSLENRIKKTSLKNSNEEEWELLKRKDEIGLISRAFQKLIEKLSSSQNKLSKSNRELIQLNKELDKRVEEEAKKSREKDLQLIEQSKLASISGVITNIAHQWRQPLSAISSLSTGLKLQKEFDQLDDKDFLEGMDRINNTTQYLSKTIDSFRDFIGYDNEIKEVILQEKLFNVVNIINETLKSYGISLENNIDKSKNTKLKIISSGFNQTILNIINNAKDILIERKTKKPWIKLDLIEDDNKVIITIEDNAGGISEDDIAHVFEPYFTTRHQSQGTGLGLHISYKIIVETLKGKLYVKNSEYGAKFFIELTL